MPDDVVYPPLFTLDPALTERVARVAELSRESLVARVQRAFPQSCPALVEDAVSAAIFDAILGVQNPNSAFARALSKDGAAGLRAVLSQAAWRKMRGQRRLKASRVELLPRATPDAPAVDDPEAELSQRELFVRLVSAIDMAASLHAKRDPARLRAALSDRFETGDSDPKVARRHGVRREVLTNARNWTRRALRS